MPHFMQFMNEIKRYEDFYSATSNRKAMIRLDFSGPNLSI